MIDKKNTVEESKIKDMRMLVSPYPAFVEKNATADDIAKMLIASPNLKSIYVVDDKLKLIGRVTLKKLIKHEFKDILPSSFEYFDALEFIGDKTAEDLMIQSDFVRDNDTLKTAFLKMYENEFDALPVVNDELRLIGNIDLLELLIILIEKKEKKANKKFLQITLNRPFHR